MTEMIKRLARAFHADDQGSRPEPYSLRREYWERKAKVMLEAIREPTAEMRLPFGEGSREAEAFKVMIDAALGKRR